MKHRTCSFLSLLTGAVEELLKKCTSEEEPPEGGKVPGSHRDAELSDCLPRPQDTPPLQRCRKQRVSSHLPKSGNTGGPVWGGPLPAARKAPLFFSFSYSAWAREVHPSKSKNKIKKSGSTSYWWGDSYIDTNILEDNLAVPCKSEYVPALRNSYWTSKNIPKGNSCSYTWDMYKTIFSSSIIHSNKKLEILMFSNRLVKLIVAYSFGRKLQRREN